MRAQHILDLMYYVGEGVDQDLEKAFYWIQSAAQKGFTHAQEALDDLF